MAFINHQKRPVQDITDSNNDNLNDDEYDVTWGGKRCRYIYNYTLQSPDCFSNDSDETESILSIQSKETIEAISEADLTSDKSCGSGCECQNTSASDHTEFEVVSSSSSSHNIDSNSSDSSTSFDYQVKRIEIVCDTSLGSDQGYIPDDNTDTQVGTLKTNLPPPACFQKCLQCKRENPNPYFQYCHTCFRYRMEFFESKPKAKKKKKLSYHKKEEISFKNSSMSSSQQSNEIGVSSLLLSQNESKHLRNVNTEMLNQDMCNICFLMPKNGVFNHGKIAHIYCCYSCAKVLWRKSNKCPLCNVKIKFVTKMIIV